MLLRVGVSNHLSIRDPQVLLFTASSLKDHQEGLIECSAAPRGSVVPALVIYGANASGKSNLIHGIQTMQHMVKHSHTRGTAGGGVPRYALGVGLELRDSEGLMGFAEAAGGWR